MPQTSDTFNLKRFIDAQNYANTFETALSEVQNGKKRTHWIWFVLPQLRGLGHSYNSRFYGISGEEEARAYLADEVLGERLRRMCEALLEVVTPELTARKVMGLLDGPKTLSCLTLFDAVCPNDIFGRCIDQLFNGERDAQTLRRLGRI